MPGGNIFHGQLSWPWAEDGDDLSTPAKRWGVATAHDRASCCAAPAHAAAAPSARSAGHNAAMAVLES